MPPEAEAAPGRVHLVGAGPGAADLLTVRALRILQSARAVLYDALVSPEVLALAPAHCLKIQTGKRAGGASMKQETINRLMLRLARRGVDVVRLKGGDPAMFGRLGEELAWLRAHGVAIEVVPGITAAMAAAAQFEFSLTHRGEARAVLFATGHLTDGPQADWRAAADPATTLAIYMGRDAIGGAAERLQALGRPAATPALAIENAGRPDARTIRASLADIAERVLADCGSGPVVIVIGEVVAAARPLKLAVEHRSNQEVA